MTVKQATERPGFWRRWTVSRSEAEAAELQTDLDLVEERAQGPIRINRCRPGQTVTVTGMVRSLTLQPSSKVPALEVELYDGTGSVTVVWLGRRRIPGIEAGRTMQVTGRLTCNTERPTIYNPRYELRPAAA